MKLNNEFVVAAPLERTWSALLDVPRVARALPGATIDSEPADGAYRGTMKVKFGAVTAEYAGTAMLQDVDEDERVASFRVEARERRGQGTAAATITSRLAEDSAGTRVSVETDLAVTGRQAQLGRGIMEDVAGGVLERFADGLEQELAGGSPGPVQPPGSEEALDLGGAVLGPLRERAAVFGAGVALGFLAGWLLRRR
ncbi:MAG TPA: SRPBCC family protein [Thermoleophilaceae bacterium]